MNYILSELSEKHPVAGGVFLVIPGAGVTAVAIVFWASTTIPSEKGLIATEGKITSLNTATKYSNDLVFTLNDSAIQYKYLDWYPHFQTVRTVMKVGESITVVTIPDDNKIWGLRKAQVDVVSFSDLVGARLRNRRWAMGLAISMPILTLVGLLSLWRKSWGQRLAQALEAAK